MEPILGEPNLGEPAYSPLSPRYGAHYDPSGYDSPGFDVASPSMYSEKDELKAKLFEET